MKHHDDRNAPDPRYQPADDRAIREAAEAALLEGQSVYDLQQLLRRGYPRCVVRARDLSGERPVVWYVYRDGNWVGGRAERGETMDELEQDLRATAESIKSDADRLAAIEDEKRTLGSDDPRLLELSREAELIAKRLVPKTVAERALAVETQD